MANPRRHVFAALGWLVWKALAKVGVPMAKKRLKNTSGRRRSA